MSLAIDQASLLGRVVAFTRSLHSAGVEVNSGNLIDLCQSITHINLGNRNDFYAAARATLVSRFDDIEMFDQVFNAFWAVNTQMFEVEVPQEIDDSDLMDAGTHLHRTLEEILLNTNFVIADESTHYKLKYKVVDFEEGSQVKRFATIGALSKMGQANLKIQVALFRGKKLVGRWDIESWLNDGLLGGDNKILFKKAAHEIVEHLKGDY